MFESDHSIKSYKQLKCAILKTADLMHAYLHLFRTPFSLVSFFLFYFPCNNFYQLVYFSNQYISNFLLPTYF